jgi:hypothetical protein
MLACKLPVRLVQLGSVTVLPSNFNLPAEFAWYTPLLSWRYTGFLNRGSAVAYVPAVAI